MATFRGWDLRGVPIFLPVTYRKGGGGGEERLVCLIDAILIVNKTAVKGFPVTDEIVS
jgi:hypothetical protein